MANPIKTTYHWLLEALFPRRCLGCRHYGTWCCAKCLASLTYPRSLHCLGCGAPTQLGEFCPHCEPGRSLNGVWVGLRYGNPLVRGMIKALKFDGVTSLAQTLGNLSNAVLTRFALPPQWHSVPTGNWHLVPVPLTRKRERARGFNQAKLLAQVVSTQCNLPVTEFLTRTRSTTPQSKLPHAERAQNIAGVFAAVPGANLEKTGIILVDDVYTTGATLEECARVLKAAGAAEVWGLVVARG